jgi:hypothetical protein
VNTTEMTLALIGTGGTALLALGAIFGKTGKILRKFGLFFEDFFGAPARDGVPARPGVMATLADQSQSLASIDKRVGQLEHNGGSTMRDAIARIEAKVTDTSAAAQEAVDLAHQAAVLAGKAALEAATSAQLTREQHVENVARLDALERDRAEDKVRVETYSAILHELGVDISLDRPA